MRDFLDDYGLALVMLLGGVLIMLGLFATLAYEARQEGVTERACLLQGHQPHECERD